MSYELSFSPEFFLAEGEPYDRSDLALNDDGKPISVWSAIANLKENERRWAELARDVFKCEPEFLTEETVLDKIRETDSCANLNTPVRVYVDPEFYYYVEVWDSRD